MQNSSSIWDIDQSKGNEDITISNIGSTGVGFFYNKLDSDFRFKNLKENSTYLTVVDSPSDKTVRVDIASSIKTLITTHATRHLTNGADPISIVTSSTNGLMLAEDKNKLDSLNINNFLMLKEPILSEDSERIIVVEPFSIRCEENNYYKFKYSLRTSIDNIDYGSAFSFIRDGEGVLSCHIGYNVRIGATVFSPLIELDREVIFNTTAYKEPSFTHIEGIFFCIHSGRFTLAFRTTQMGNTFIIQAGSMLEYIEQKA